MSMSDMLKFGFRSVKMEGCSKTCSDTGSISLFGQDESRMYIINLSQKHYQCGAKEAGTGLDF
jgi:hypothetical protein